PDGLSPPSLTHATSSSLNVSWSAPAHSNAPGPLRYSLQMRTSPQRPGVRLVENATDTFSYHVEGLSPFTQYVFRVVVSHTHGQTVGPWATLRTAEDSPGPVDPPAVSELHPRSVIVTWVPPSQPNGMITNYTLYLYPSFISSLDFKPSSVFSTSTTLSSTSGLNQSLMPSTEAAHLNPSHDIISTSVPTTPDSRPVSMSTINTGSNNSSSTIQGTRTKLIPNPFSSMRPGITEENQIESTGVTWSPPLIPNGEIHGYEIRLPEPRIFHDSGNASALNITIKDLIPYTNYSITLLSCSNGGGHVGGCTESLPMPATTLPTIPEGLEPLSVVAVSESFLAISWQPPSRPNGPNIRYKLLRRKTHQPLAIATVPTVTAVSPPPSEDLHRWLHVYSGTKLFYQDKGLSRFTRYQYQLEVHNDVGYSSGEIVEAVTMAGVPHHPPSLSAHAVNHTAVQVDWTQPSLQDLQGEVSNGAHNTTKASVNVTTEDGEPEGMSAPEVVPVNSSTVRVLWFPPLQPNGAVTGYYIYLNDLLHGSVDNSSGSYLLGDLMPFTVYNVQVEVCTVYACVRSNVTQTTTVEDLPADLATPHAHVISPRPSGIMLGYDVLRRTLRSCAVTSTGVTAGEGSGGVKFRCSYLQCPASHGVCGTSCFHPDTQVCCSGLLNTKKAHHQCCEGSYLTLSNSSSPVCCNGKLLPALPDHQCCGGYYVHVKHNENCCPDPSQGRVAVGMGDSCCGGVPYSTKGGQLCCRGSLHDGYGVRCCGGQIVDDTLVCCDDAQRGEVHIYTPGFICCGQEYINSSTSLCCVGKYGNPSMHPAGNETVTLQCCGSKHECMQGAVCPAAAASTAYCGSCDLDPSTTACTWLLSAHTQPDTPYINITHEALSQGLSTHANRSHNTFKMADENRQLDGSLCASHEEVVYSGDANRYTYTGDITHYVILRDGQERYRGDETSFTDVGGIRPFQEFSYQLRVCNRAGCTDSTQEFQIWSEATRPNGKIQRSHLNQTGVGTIFTHISGPRNYTVFGLQPYTDYSLCWWAAQLWDVEPAHLPQDAPCKPPLPLCLLFLSGVWTSPRHLVINTSAVELYWDQPPRPNGHISQYRLNRDGHTIFTGDHRDQNYTDTGLVLNRRYVYELQASTGGGTGVSDKYVIQTPVSCPTGIQPPHNVTVLGPHSVSLAWTPPAQLHSSQPVNYNILLNPGSDNALLHHAGPDLHLTVTGLQPFTAFYIRVQACQSDGCGVGGEVYIRSLETAPEGLLPPTVKAAGASVLEIHWSPPQQPNGVITSYHIYRRPVGTEEELLVFIWSSGPLEFFDASPALRPFSFLQYRVRSYNSKGSVLSQWALAQTLQAEPQDMAPPTVTPTGAYSAHLKWSEPGQPNGLISHYRLVYKKHQQDPTLNSTAVTALTVEKRPPHPV
ncbi:hypothetical protein KUCAC02_001544, partial [Chaenocephalus aceratus]